MCTDHPAGTAPSALERSTFSLASGEKPHCDIQSQIPQTKCQNGLLLTTLVGLVEILALELLNICKEKRWKECPRLQEP